MPELTIAAIAVGGGLGSVARFIVTREMERCLGNFLPYGTLVVNVLGSLALGWLATVFWIVRKSTLLCGLGLL